MCMGSATTIKPDSKLSTSVAASNSSPMTAVSRFCRKIFISRKEKHRPAADQDHCGSVNTNHNEDLEDLHHRVFTYFDENGDGKISAAELQSCMRRMVGGGQLGLSDEEAEMAVSSSDADGDGMLGLEDFAKLMEAGNSSEEEKVKELREAFGMYSAASASASANDDTAAAEKGAGANNIIVCITPKSLKRMLSRLGQPTTVNNCKAMIQKFDLNGDGVLDFNEFRIMMT